MAEDKLTKRNSQLTCHWTEEEKELFLKAVRVHGLCNINEICKEVPSHTKEDIEDFIKQQIKLKKYYKFTNIVKLLDGSGNSLQRPEKRCIDRWLDLLCKMKADTPRHFNVLSFCMKLISDFGEHGQTNGVDFQKLYLYISHALQGITPCELNEDTEQFLQSLLENLATEHREESGFPKEKMFLNSLDFGELARNKSKNNYNLRGESVIGAMKNIQKNRYLNPLNVSLQNLIDLG